MSLIENIRKKCEEITDQVTFIYTLVGKAKDPKWVENDPAYVHVKAVYESAKAVLESLVAELP